MPPHPEFACETDGLNLDASEGAKLPRLFRTYLRSGAKVCSSPAIDRQFKTIDFLALFDIAEMDERTAKLFF